MSDDRLFASNNAIGRKWFFLNIIILCIITIITGYIFNNFIIPDVRTEEYYVIAKSMLIFLYVVYAVTFLSLVDRRIYDILGDRDKTAYKISSAFVFLVVLFNVYVFSAETHIIKQAMINTDTAYCISIVLDIMFILMIFIAGMVKGQISSISMDEYKRRIRYK